MFQNGSQTQGKCSRLEKHELGQIFAEHPQQEEEERGGRNADGKFQNSQFGKKFTQLLFIQDINCYLNNTSNLDHSENLQGVSFANIQLSRPNSR